MPQGYWDCQIPKVTAATVPNAEFASEYNVFIESTTGVYSKKDNLGVVTPVVSPSNSAVSIFTGAATAGGTFVDASLIGANVEFVTVDGDIFVETISYTFDDTTGTFTWVGFVAVGGEVIKAFYYIP